MQSLKVNASVFNITAFTLSAELGTPIKTKLLWSQMNVWADFLGVVQPMSQKRPLRSPSFTDQQLQQMFDEQFQVRPILRAGREQDGFLCSCIWPIVGLPQKLLLEALKSTVIDLPEQEAKLHRSLGEIFTSFVPLGRTSQNKGKQPQYLKEENCCRSTSAKPADKRSPQQRTSQVHREGSRTVKHSNLLKHLLYHSLINSYLRIRSRYVST